VSSAIDGLAGKLLGGREAHASVVGAVAVVVQKPIVHKDLDIITILEELTAR